MLVDDHAVVRAGYRRLLALEPDCEVVAEYAGADAALSALRTPTAGVSMCWCSTCRCPGAAGSTCCAA